MNGIILIDKPRDWTSHDVVGKLRGILGERRIGHSGTLDPMATGLLTVFVGRATRAVEFAEADSKEYIAGLRLGVSTDTQDITGNILRQSDTVPDKVGLERVLDSFTGDISQIPPMYSAIKVGGKKLYELARRGVEVERKPRPVTIYELELTENGGGEYGLRVVCSAGTYVRTLCHDIGERLGCGAVMSSLRRTRAGEYDISQAVTIEELQRRLDEGTADELILPLDSLFKSYPVFTAGEAEQKKILCGAKFAASAADGRYRVYAPDGGFLMFGECVDGTMTSVKNFFEVTK